MAFPTGYTYHNGQWWKTSDGSGPYYINAAGQAIQIRGPLLAITEANLALITADATNIGLEYFVTDRRGGCHVGNIAGTGFQELSPALNDYFTSTTWASRGTGSFVGQKKIITNLGNQPAVEAIWDGTYWQPAGGRQLIYALKAQVTGSAGTSSVANIPSVTIPGNLMNINGGFEVDIHTHTLSSVASVANTISLTFGGFELMGTDRTTNRRVWNGRRVRNVNSASVQTVMSNASGTGAYEQAANDPKETTKDTTADQTLVGTATATHATSIQNRIDEYKVWWIGG